MTDAVGNKAEKEEFGPVFSRIYSFFAGRSRKHQAVYGKIVEDIVGFAPARVLEIGCGPGIVAASIAARLPDAEIECIDPSPTMVELARKRIAKQQLGSRVRVGIGSSETQHEAGSFDLVFTSLSFHHWRNRMADLANLLRCLAPGGTMIIYENLIQGGSSHGHGITMDFVESTSFDGYSKGYEVMGELVALKFVRPE